MASKTITSRQCKIARDLLKWNIYDLSNRTNIPPKHLERFERNLTRLTMPENSEVKRIYEKNGLIFTDNLDVIFRKEGEKDDAPASPHDIGNNYDMDVEGLDITLKEKKPVDDADKIWVHAPEYTGPDRRNARNQLHFTGNEKRKDRQDMAKKVIDKYKK